MNEYKQLKSKIMLDLDHVIKVKDEAKKIVLEQVKLINEAAEIAKDENMHPLEKMGRMYKIDRRAYELRRKMAELRTELLAMEILIEAAKAEMN